jgi:hypothetical protein
MPVAVPQWGSSMRTRLATFLLVSCIACCIPAPAHAAFTLSYVPVNITAPTDAQVPAPGLAGFQCYDFILDTDVGDDFQSMRIFIRPYGQLFMHPLASTVPGAPPNPALVQMYPALRFTTHFEGPGGSLILLGGYDGVAELPPSQAFFSATIVGAVLGDTASITDGMPVRLMRFTFSGQVPVGFGRVSVNVGGATQNQQFTFNPPEPGCLAPVAAGLVLGLRRRRAASATRDALGRVRLKQR